jgi:hypothetical protein
MSYGKRAALGLLTAALVVTSVLAARAQARGAYQVVTLSTNQSEIVNGFQNEGWWTEAGIHIVTDDNYFTGSLGGENFRDFFIFDASLVQGCARRAVLQVPHGDGSGDLGMVATGALLALHGVTTDPVVLKSGRAVSPEIFTDLGDGASYGSFFEPTAAPYKAEVFVVTLSAAGLADLNAAIRARSFFSVGGMIVGEPVNTALFFDTPILDAAGSKRPTNLLVTVGPCT